MKVWKMISLFNQVTFRFYVNFPGCILLTFCCEIFIFQGKCLEQWDDIIIWTLPPHPGCQWQLKVLVKIPEPKNFKNVMWQF